MFAVLQQHWRSLNIRLFLSCISPMLYGGQVVLLAGNQIHMIEYSMALIQTGCTGML